MLTKKYKIFVLFILFYITGYLYSLEREKQMTNIITQISSIKNQLKSSELLNEINSIRNEFNSKIKTLSISNPSLSYKLLQDYKKEYKNGLNKEDLKQLESRKSFLNRLIFTIDKDLENKKIIQDISVNKKDLYVNVKLEFPNKTISIFCLGEHHANQGNFEVVRTIMRYTIDNEKLGFIYEDSIFKNPDYLEKRNINGEVTLYPINIQNYKWIEIIKTRKLHEYYLNNKNVTLHDNKFFSYDFRNFDHPFPLNFKKLYEVDFNERSTLNKLYDIINTINFNYVLSGKVILKDKEAYKRDLRYQIFTKIYLFTIEYFYYLFIDNTMTEDQKKTMENAEEEILNLFLSNDLENITPYLKYNDHRFDLIFEMFRESFTNIDSNIIDKERYIYSIMNFILLRQNKDLPINFNNFIDIFTLNKIFSNNNNFDKFFLYFGYQHVMNVMTILNDKNIYNNTPNITVQYFNNDVRMFLKQITGSDKVLPIQYYDSSNIPKKTTIDIKNNNNKNKRNEL